MRIFTDHPNSVGETYWEHLATAGGFAWTMIGAGLACLVHALLPFMFQKTGSRAIGALYDRMIAHRRKAGNIGEAHHFEWVI